MSLNLDFIQTVEVHEIVDYSNQIIYIYNPDSKICENYDLGKEIDIKNVIDKYNTDIQYVDQGQQTAPWDGSLYQVYLQELADDYELVELYFDAETNALTYYTALGNVVGKYDQPPTETDFTDDTFEVPSYCSASTSSRPKYVITQN